MILSCGIVHGIYKELSVQKLQIELSLAKGWETNRIGNPRCIKQNYAWSFLPCLEEKKISALSTVESKFRQRVDKIFR